MSDESQIDVPAPDHLSFRPAGPVPKARLTVVEMVYYQPLHPPGQVVDIGGGSFSVPIFEPADDQCVPGRVQTVGTDWKALDFLYLTDKPTAVVVVENLTGTGRQVSPTPEQAEADSKRVVELGIMHQGDFDNEEHARPIPNGIIVRPGQAHRFEANQVLYARCRTGPAKVRVAAAPGEAV